MIYLEYEKLERLRRAELLIQHRNRIHGNTKIRRDCTGNVDRWIDPRNKTK